MSSRRESQGAGLDVAVRRPLTMTAVIPTKNRPEDLIKAVGSVLAQRRLPDELILVDQSPGDESKRAVDALVGRRTDVAMKYCHDPAVAGLVAAKEMAAQLATSEIVCYLEDDIVLDPEYFAEIERAFQDDPDMLGCCGIITNAARQFWLHVALHRLFFRGIFLDARPGIQRDAAGPAMVRSNVLWGGQTAWHRRVLAAVPFDRRFHMMEDIEFSSRVARMFGPNLWVNKHARLLHFYSTTNRDQHGARQRRTAVEALLFYGKRRDWPGARRGLAFVMVWWAGAALGRAARHRSLAPLYGFFAGIRDGRAMLAKAGSPGGPPA